MKQFLASLSPRLWFTTLLISSSVVWAVASWDSQFTLYKTFSTSTANACVSVPNGRYLKVNCTGVDGGGADTFLGSGDTTYDAGYCDISTDGGSFCDLVRFSLGEKQYVRGLGSTDRVCGRGFQGQTSYCSVFLGAE